MFCCSWWCVKGSVFARDKQSRRRSCQDNGEPPFCFSYLKLKALASANCSLQKTLLRAMKCHVPYGMHNLRMLAHNRMQKAQCQKMPCCRWRRISRRKLYMCEQMIHTNKKLKFLTTKTSQKTQAYIRSCICTRQNVLVCFVFAILK